MCNMHFYTEILFGGLTLNAVDAKNVARWSMVYPCPMIIRFAVFT